MECTQLSLFGRTCPEHSAPTPERTSERFWKSLSAWNSQTLLFLDLRGGRWKHAGAIAGDGWSLAWRQLDAQYWGVPQRRKRIALVADFRGQRAGEILFERAGMSGNSCESIPTWKEVAGLATNCPAGNDRVVESGCFCIAGNVIDRSETAGANGIGAKEDISYTLNTVDRPAVAFSINPLASNSMKSANPHSGFNETKVSRTLDCFDPNPAKNQGGLAIVQPVPVLNDQGGSMMGVSYDVTGTLRASEHGHQPVVFDARGNGSGNIVPTITGDHESRITDYTAIAVEKKTFARQRIGEYKESEQSSTINSRDYKDATDLVAEKELKNLRWIVRRLTPTECERLQGYPDGWTDIGEWTDTKGKKHKAADSPRYKALGNSIALPQWFWIAQKMKPYMGGHATLGSLFDGLGGFPLVWETTYGTGTARWASEIEEFPIAVTKKWFGGEEVKD